MTERRVSVYRKMEKPLVLWAAAFAIARGALQSPAFADDPLFQGFQTPPDSAKPRVWWHWMNGNVTTEGIRKDLEWMKQIGVGGVQHFDGARDTPQIVPRRLVYMTPDWQGALKYSVELADRLGIEFAIASSPGWSETGGPWVRPEDGMKKLVWSETQVLGGRRYTGRLAVPPSVAGPFQDLPKVDLISGKEVQGPSFYRDALVIAFPTLRWHFDPQPIRTTTSASSADVSRLSDGEMAKSLSVPLSIDHPAWILFDFGKVRSFRAMSVVRPPALSVNFTVEWYVEASNDASDFHRVVNLPSDELPNDYSVRQTTVSFARVKARFLRLTAALVPAARWFDPAANAPGAASSLRFAAPPDHVSLNEVKFFHGARVNRFEEKAGFTPSAHYFGMANGAGEPAEVVDLRNVVNLTARMRSDGTLDWTPPPGKWTVQRFGYSLTGMTNHPASAEATGLEVDKLDRGAIRRYLDTYIGKFKIAVGPGLMGKRGIQAFLTDSIESSGQNWTPTIISEFKSRRGYDPTRWLPVLTGAIVGDAARSDRFLWDFRKTLMELLRDAHYRQVADSAHQNGLVYYSEALEGHARSAIGDDLDMRQYADIPMAAIWTSYDPTKRDGIRNHIIDIMGAASVSHVFGRNLVAAESFTTCDEPWAYSPVSLRPVIDLAFALGVNRAVIHTSVHQPNEQAPGLTLGPCGQHFNRHETWAEFAAPWMTYLSRSAYLLQQGRPSADVAWFYGEEGSLAQLSDSMPTDLPQGYGFDFVNANILLNYLSARDGQLISKGGSSYRLLYLGGSSTRMTLAVLRKLKALSDRGVAIAGRRPVGSPSLADDGKEVEYRRLVAELWDRGKILEGGDPSAAMARLGVVRDFAYDKPEADSRLMFLHRQLADGGDIYFITNRNARSEHIEARFRVTGRRPELWHADTGNREPVSWRLTKQQTVVPLTLAPNESVFVLFRDVADKVAEDVPLPKDSLVAHIDGDWQLSFEPGRGAPEKPIKTPLVSWTESHDAAIKYFSGIGTYRTTFVGGEVARSGASSGRLLLDLGEVHELAEVRLNGKSVGTAWHAPFQLDVTAALLPGVNTLEVRVANLWVNRLIGDKQPGAKPIAFTVTSTYRPDAPLRPSGLMGPVTLIRRTR